MPISPNAAFVKFRLLSLVGSSLLLSACSNNAPSLDRAQEAIRRDDWQGADEILNRLMQSGNATPEARMLAAQVAAHHENFTKCLEHLRVASHCDRFASASLLAQGECLREMGFGRKAETIWKSGLERFADSSRFRLGLIELYYEESRWTEATATAWQLYDRTPEKLTALLALLRFEVVRIAPHLIGEKLEHYVANDPEDWDAKLALGHNQVLLGRPGGRAIVEECLQHDPQNRETLAVYVSALAELGDFNTVRSMLQDAPDELRNRAEFCLLFGKIFERIDPEAARAAYERGLEIEPFNRKLHNQLGQLLRRIQPSEAAEEHIKQADALHQLREALSAAYAKMQLEFARQISEGNSSPTGVGTSDSMAADCARLGELTESLGKFREALAWHHEALRRDSRLQASEEAVTRLKSRLDNQAPHFIPHSDGSSDETNR